jgi:hypothetical protein
MRALLGTASHVMCAEIKVLPVRERESSLLATYLSESTRDDLDRPALRDDLDRPALRHGSLSSLFQAALYLPGNSQLQRSLAMIADS